MERLPEDCIGVILEYCRGKTLATLAMVSRQWTQRALAEEVQRFLPGESTPDITYEDDWIFVVSTGAYLTVVRNKFGPVSLYHACCSGCPDMMMLALALGATDYQDGFESAAEYGHYDIAIHLWGLIAEPNLESSIFAVYAGGNTDLMNLVRPTSQELWNEAVAGACRGNGLALLREILPKYNNNKARLLVEAFDGGATEVLDFLTENGIKCEDEDDLSRAVRIERYDIFDLFLSTNPFLDLEDAFYVACTGGHFEIVQRLLPRELDENALCVGCMLACFGRYLEVIRRIIPQVSNIYVNDWLSFLCGPEDLDLYASISHDSSALRASYEEIVDYLVEVGADDFEGTREIAKWRNCDKMVEIMQKKIDEAAYLASAS
jgi:hypothetical protein